MPLAGTANLCRWKCATCPCRTDKRSWKQVRHDVQRQVAQKYHYLCNDVFVARVLPIREYLQVQSLPFEPGGVLEPVSECVVNER